MLKKCLQEIGLGKKERVEEMKDLSIRESKTVSIVINFSFFSEE